MKRDKKVLPSFNCSQQSSDLTMAKTGNQVNRQRFKHDIWSSCNRVYPILIRAHEETLE